MPKSLFVTTIKKQSAFAYLNKVGTKFHNPYFILIYHKNFVKHYPLPIEPFIIMGMKVTKKTGNAVVRNKIRRRIKHLIRLISKKLKPSKYGILVIPRSGFEKIKFSLLYNELQKIMHPELNS